MYLLNEDKPSDIEEPAKKEITPFDFIRDITLDKKNLLESNIATEKEYKAYIINIGLSLYYDTIMYANLMNMNYNLPSNMQHDFYFNVIHKKKRWSKWHKKLDKFLDAYKICKNYYKINNRRAEEVSDILTDRQLNELDRRLIKGGVNRKKDENNE